MLEISISLVVMLFCSAAFLAAMRLAGAGRVALNLGMVGACNQISRPHRPNPRIQPEL